MESCVQTIALDGPAGSGKSTLGQQLAADLGYVFLDTGTLYRAITRHVLNETINPEDAEAMTDYAAKLQLTILQMQPEFKFEINATQVTKLNTPEIDKTVPIVAAYDFIREQVRIMQRKIATEGKLILAGRDIGTVVLPDADLKIYLDVSLEERAKRRHAKQNDAKRTLEDVREDMRLRDIADATREASPMRIAAGAVIIKTDGLTLEQVVAQVKQHACPPQD